MLSIWPNLAKSNILSFAKGLKVCQPDGKCHISFLQHILTTQLEVNKSRWILHLILHLDSIPDSKILALSKLKALADDNFIMAGMEQLFFRTVENVVEK